MFLRFLTQGQRRSVARRDADASASRRDCGAFEELYERPLRALVYSLVLRIFGGRRPREEVVQDVFLQLWRNSAPL